MQNMSRKTIISALYFSVRFIKDFTIHDLEICSKKLVF